MSVEAEVRGPWIRIEAWLSANVPSLARALRPPASAEAIAAAEAEVGVAFPPELVASLALHDGQSPREFEVFGAWGLMALTKIVETWRALARMADAGTLHTHDEPEWIRAVGPARPRSWDRAWIPVATAGTGDLLVLDLNPPAGGTRGQVLTYGPRSSTRAVLAPDFGAWLGQVADQLESGAFVVEDESYLKKKKA